MNKPELEKLATQCCAKTYSGYPPGIGIYEPFGNMEENKTHEGLKLISIILVIILFWYIYKFMVSKRR